MKYLYNAAIFFYSLLIWCISFFNNKAKSFLEGRKNWRVVLKENIEANSKYIWFHCASLGEFEQGRPVIEEVHKQFPEYKIILSFFSPSGYEIRKNYELASVVVYLPIDTKKNARDFVDTVKPEKAFFVKYEFWYHYINELNKQEIPLYIISAIFREGQQFFKSTPWSEWFRKMLYKFTHLFVQDENSAALLEKVGITNYTVSGDTRFDRVASIANGAKNIPIVEKFIGDSRVIIAGSTWKPDEELLVEFINKSTGLKFIIAPHEVSATNVNRLQQLLKKPAFLYSKAEKVDADKYEVLIIDSVGLLSSLYQYGSIAYIGGGFGVGIHNILEAATFGLPIVFGPNYKRFKEAVELVIEGGAISINNISELKQSFNHLMFDEKVLEYSSDVCKKYVEKNVGATKVIIKKVFNT